MLIKTSETFPSFNKIEVAYVPTSTTNFIKIGPAVRAQKGNTGATATASNSVNLHAVVSTYIHI